MTNFHAEELTIELDESVPGRIVANWLGESSARNPAQLLMPWFNDVFAYAKARSAGLEMSFENLEHFNSSTISALVQIINGARDLQLPLTIRYDGNRRWQALSFEALQSSVRRFRDDKGPPLVFVGGPTTKR